MASPVIYIDADFLLGHQEENDIGYHARDEIGTCENMKETHGYILKSPMITIGEAASKCCFGDFNADDLANLIREKEIDTPVPSHQVLALASEFIQTAGIQSCDALLAAHAILDPAAGILLTTDGLLQNSPQIKQKIDELGINNLKIRSYIKKKR